MDHSEIGILIYVLKVDPLGYAIELNGYENKESRMMPEHRWRRKLPFTEMEENRGGQVWGKQDQEFEIGLLNLTFL